MCQDFVDLVARRMREEKKGERGKNLAKKVRTKRRSIRIRHARRKYIIVA